MRDKPSLESKAPNFQHSLRDLDASTHSSNRARKFSAPRMLLWNAELACQLELPHPLRTDSKLQSQFFSGQIDYAGSAQYSYAYAGHQFGHFAGLLGDGRAHMLGEWSNSKQVYDIQLKGSGPTPYSRGGDGLCALGPALREYLMSEAMHALGVPSCRSLSVVSTGESVVRESISSGAVVSRVAQSHLRVGSFQWFAASEQHTSLAKLCTYTMQRHFADKISSQQQLDIDHKDFKQLPLRLLNAVIDKQIELICHWQRVGFIHGVMNTDNCSIAGETIDFGPCAMLSNYNSSAVFSSIDRMGRYAFGQQPSMMNWNMARLAESLLPLVSNDSHQALAQLQPIIESIPERFKQRYQQMLANKFGLATSTSAQQQLCDRFLKLMQQYKLDYTNSFRELGRVLKDGEIGRNSVDAAPPSPYFNAAFKEVLAQWRTLVQKQPGGIHRALELMQKNNPELIPRNHLIEQALEQANTLKEGSLSLAQQYLQAWQHPYQARSDDDILTQASLEFDQQYRTFCGT